MQMFGSRKLENITNKQKISLWTATSSKSKSSNPWPPDKNLQKEAVSRMYEGKYAMLCPDAAASVERFDACSPVYKWFAWY